MTNHTTASASWRIELMPGNAECGQPQAAACPTFEAAQGTAHPRSADGPNTMCMGELRMQGFLSAGPAAPTAGFVMPGASVRDRVDTREFETTSNMAAETEETVYIRHGKIHSYITSTLIHISIPPSPATLLKPSTAPAVANAPISCKTQTPALCIHRFTVLLRPSSTFHAN